MTPLGSGMIFRFGEPIKAHQALGILVERTLLKNDDILMVDDALATQLTQSFVNENAGVLDSTTLNLQATQRATFRGNFSKLFNNSLQKVGEKMLLNANHLSSDHQEDPKR